MLLSPTSYPNHIPHTPCPIPHTPYLMSHTHTSTSCPITHTSYLRPIPHTPYLMPHTSYPMSHTPCPISHVFYILHSTCSISHVYSMHVSCTHSYIHVYDRPLGVWGDDSIYCTPHCSYMSDGVNYLQTCLRRDRERAAAFKAMGLMVYVLKDRMDLEPVLATVRSNLPGGKETTGK